jgi:hypothetical protein
LGILDHPLFLNLIAQDVQMDRNCIMQIQVM